MTTNPSISIPEAAIEAAAEAFLANEPGTTTSSWGPYREWTHHVVEAILRAAAPHLVGELVEAAELVCQGGGPVVTRFTTANHSLKCPTCGHIHPQGVGMLHCGCQDCSLLWTAVPYDVLAPEYQERFRDLWERATEEQEQALKEEDQRELAQARRDVLRLRKALRHLGWGWPPHPQAIRDDIVLGALEDTNHYEQHRQEEAPSD